MTAFEIIWRLTPLVLAFVVWIVWLKLSLRCKRQHGIILPLLLVVFVGLRSAMGLIVIGILWRTGRSALLLDSLARMQERLRAGDLYCLIELNLNVSSVAGWALLARVAWMELKGSTGDRDISMRRSYGIAALCLLLVSCSVGFPTIKTVSQPVLEMKRP